MNYNEVTRSGREYIGYEYKTINIDSEKASMYLDAYKNFGWISDYSLPARSIIGTITIKLKRDRKIPNKAELTRLQQHFEACMDEIAGLEKSKEMKAMMVSLMVGLAGTAFLAGSVFAVTNEPPLVLLCAILGVPGLVGWALPYFIFKALVKKRMTEVAPLIEQKYDEAHEICEKGNALIHS